MDTTEPATKAGIKRVEITGFGLAAASGLAIWAASTVLGVPSTDAAGRHVLLHFFGLSQDNICGWIILLSVLGGCVGLAQLAYGLIGRIPKSWIRHTAGWTTFAAAVVASPFVLLTALLVFMIAAGIGDQTRFEAPNGQSVVVTQDGFDGDGVDIYTEHGIFHYVRNRDANELGGFPRVKDRNCELTAAENTLLFTCGTETVTVVP
ncbi:hypothetical protein [Arthrobacter gengyunqii]|uniref:Uncharacterized protein n=1 Tax=Arthrobacter gengyunqii TaxID=2886940 RepID=A0ABS8GDX2_9MICC|nr:hypothetical protein [Arthrobacter gengyunqii]MCC3264814.1 hypothetical protein [Arthrobacter gengyunqii]